MGVFYDAYWSLLTKFFIVLHSLFPCSAENSGSNLCSHFIYQIIKTMEINGTNLDDHHLGRIVRNIRIKQFVYPESIIPREVTVKCSACNQVGHNKKNKSCPLHEIHPELTFSDSEDEEEIENDH